MSNSERRGIDREKYLSYLRSAEWQSKRSQVIARDGCCQSCGRKKAKMHVHHLTYDRLYNELLEDLQLLCEACHVELHRREQKAESERIRQEAKAARAAKEADRQRRAKHRKAAKKSRNADLAKHYDPRDPDDRAQMRLLGIPIPDKYRW